MTALSIVGLAIGCVTGAGGIGAAIWCIARVKGFDITVALNNELRQGLADEREARANDRERFTREIADERVECAAAIGDLRGQVSVLTGGLAENLLSAVVSALHSPDRRHPAEESNSHPKGIT